MIGDLPEEAAAGARRIIEQVHKLTAMMTELTRFADRLTVSSSGADVASVIRCVSEVVAPIALERDVRIQVGACEESHVQGETPLMQLLLHLTEAGIRAVPRGREVELSSSRAALEPPPDEGPLSHRGEGVVVTVRWRGAQVPDKPTRLRLQPWFDPDNSDIEQSLALAVVYGIAREHRGWIVLERDSDSVAWRIHWPASRLDAD
jgi:signal transduction histidine kinase